MKHRVVTKPDLSSLELRQALTDLTLVLKANNIEPVTVLFGFGWGNYFNNWREMELNLDDILPMAEYAENRRYGKIGDDDLIIRFRIRNFSCEFQFCHHADVHWEFIPDREMPPVFGQILEFFKNHFDALYCSREPPYTAERYKREKWVPIDIAVFEGGKFFE